MNMLLGFCFLTFVVYHVSAMECYNCLSGCNDLFSSSGVAKISCNGSCLKTKTNGNVFRTCLSSTKKDECDEKNDVHVCACTSNLCNGATRQYMTTFSVMTTIACVVLNIIKQQIF